MWFLEHVSAPPAGDTRTAAPAGSDCVMDPGLGFRMTPVTPLDDTHLGSYVQKMYLTFQ